MKSSFLPLTILSVLVLSIGVSAHAQDISLSVAPSTIVQGDIVMVQVQGVGSDTEIKTITFNGKELPLFTYQGIPTAFVGIRLTQKPGDYIVRAVLGSGQIIEKTVTVEVRQSPEKPLGIPLKLGGDTVTSAKKMVNTLQKDNRSLAKLKTAKSALWTNAFILPLVDAAVTDPYGYVRQTDGYSIAHLGTDFRAATGTPVMAMNVGIVRKAQFYNTYGDTVVIDHGLGLSTLYMHLSKIDVNVGEMVNQGQVIGWSGSTGYATGPHLHVSVHIGGVSVDPMEFLGLFK
jgi:murein DD-endopeptidase MepM/ murein hydrolase activator NlpD